MHVELHELSKLDVLAAATADSGLPEPITKEGKSIVSEATGVRDNALFPPGPIFTPTMFTRMALDRQSSRVHHVHANVVTRTSSP